MTNHAVVLSYPDSLPDAGYINFQKELEAHGVPVLVERTTAPVYASLEWAVPSLVVAYLLKPFLETLLKKTAEDAYPSIKAAFKTLVRSLFGCADESRPRRISSLLSLYFQSRDGYKVKALIWEGIPAEVEDEALDKLFELIEQHYELKNGDLLRQLLPPVGPPLRWRTLFIRFDLEKRRWESVDVVAEARERNQQPDE